MYEYIAVNREEEIDMLEGDVIAVEFKVSGTGLWLTCYVHIFLYF